MVATGAERVVIGTAAVDDPAELRRIVEEVGPQAVVVALDVRAGRATGSGWLDSGRDLAAVIDSVIEAGVVRVLVTGITRDGTMSGPDVELLNNVRAIAPAMSIIASGGVGSLDDLTALAGSEIGIEGAIVGRALYENAFSFEQAVEAGRTPSTNT